MCAKIDEEEEVFLQLDRQMTDMVIKYLPEFLPYKGEYGRMIVKVSKAMYGLIQSPKLWYNEVTRFLQEREFKICKEDECIL